MAQRTASPDNRHPAYAIRIILAAMVLLAMPALGGDAELPPLQCNENGSAPEVNACAYDEFSAADKVLDSHYKMLMSRLDDLQQQQLRTEQRAWLSARDPKCREETLEFESTTGWIYWFHKCLAAETAQRTSELINWTAK